MAAHDGIGYHEEEIKIKLFPLIVSGCMCCFVHVMTLKLIPKLKDMFIKANLFGIDMSKTTSEKV